MSQYLPDFVVVVHPASAYPDTILLALRVNKAVALNVLTYAAWLKTDPAPDHNVLYIRENGEMFYAKNAPEIALIRAEIASLLRE